jgi:hypothetical protein
LLGRLSTEGSIVPPRPGVRHAGVTVEPILGAVLGERASWPVSALPWSARCPGRRAALVGGRSVGAGFGHGCRRGCAARRLGSPGVLAVRVLLLTAVQVALFMRRDA